MLSQEKQDEIYDEARSSLLQMIGEPEPRHGLCLYWALAGYGVLSRQGLKPMLQAGSCSWRFLRPDLDNGREPTHYSVIWSPDRIESRIAVKLGALPEMHVWLAIKEPVPQLIDFSTGYIPNACPYEWTGAKPPRYLWTTEEAFPSDDAVYIPIKEAVDYAEETLRKLAVSRARRSQLQRK